MTTVLQCLIYFTIHTYIAAVDKYTYNRFYTEYNNTAAVDKYKQNIQYFYRQKTFSDIQHLNNKNDNLRHISTILNISWDPRDARIWFYFCGSQAGVRQVRKPGRYYEIYSWNGIM